MGKRVFLIVLDSFGVGELPDAASFGDEGSNTLRSVARREEFDCPNMTRLGLFNITGVYRPENITLPTAPEATFAKMAERSMGKDTTTGHWEIAGAVSERALPTYPEGFPPEVIDEFIKRSGRGVLCNMPYSGTEVIKDFGEEHLRTGKLIVYTSADSVFQIAAHSDIVALQELYSYCEIARDILQGEHGVGRVIARPFGEKYPFKRLSGRHDYSLECPKKTALDILSEEGYDVISVGKISDIFAGRGVTESHPTKSNAEGMELTRIMQSKDFNGLCFVNLVDFDMLYGHRNDAVGYAAALTEFDRFLGDFLDGMREDDVLIITADHGCDPETPSTDHSREYTPMLMLGGSIAKGVDLGVKDSFADIGATILELLGANGRVADGESFLSQLI